MKLSEAIRGRATTHKEQVILWPKQLFAWAADAAAQEAEVERLRGALEWLANKHLREVGTFATGSERKALVAALVAAALAAQEASDE